MPGRRGGLATGPRKRSAQGFVQGAASSSGLAQGPGSCQAALLHCRVVRLWRRVPGLLPACGLYLQTRRLWVSTSGLPPSFPVTVSRTVGSGLQNLVRNKNRPCHVKASRNRGQVAGGPAGREWGCACVAHGPQTSGAACVLAQPGDGKGRPAGAPPALREGIADRWPRLTAWHTSSSTR